MTEICAHTVCRRRTSKAYWSEEKKTYEYLCSVHAPKTITLTKASYEALTREREEAEQRANDFLKEIRIVRDRLRETEREREEAIKRLEEGIVRVTEVEKEAGPVDQLLLDSIAHAIQTCDEETGSDGACDCCRYIASVLRRYLGAARRNKKRAETAEREREELRQRADRAEAQLAEARREAERLRVALHSVEWSNRTFCAGMHFLHCPACDGLKEYGHADDCIVGAALNPPAEVEDEQHPQPNP